MKVKTNVTSGYMQVIPNTFVPADPTQYRPPVLPQQTPCPCCGYCPHCGRRNTDPYTYPNIWPTITCTPGTLGTATSGLGSSSSGIAGAQCLQNT